MIGGHVKGSSLALKVGHLVSKDQAANIQAAWKRSCETGELFVLAPGWDFVALPTPAVAGPLVDYLEQLGDA